MHVWSLFCIEQVKIGNNLGDDLWWINLQTFGGLLWQALEKILYNMIWEITSLTTEFFGLITPIIAITQLVANSRMRNAPRITNATGKFALIACPICLNGHITSSFFWSYLVSKKISQFLTTHLWFLITTIKTLIVSVTDPWSWYASGKSIGAIEGAVSAWNVT